MLAFLLEVVVTLIIVGLVLWLLTQIPMDPTIQRVSRAVVIVVACIWLLGILLRMIGYPLHFPG